MESGGQGASEEGVEVIKAISNKSVNGRFETGSNKKKKQR